MSPALRSPSPPLPSPPAITRVTFFDRTSPSLLLTHQHPNSFHILIPTLRCIRPLCPRAAPSAFAIAFHGHTTHDTHTNLTHARTRREKRVEEDDKPHENVCVAPSARGVSVLHATDTRQGIPTDDPHLSLSSYTCVRTKTTRALPRTVVSSVAVAAEQKRGRCKSDHQTAYTSTQRVRTHDPTRAHHPLLPQILCACAKR
jgi:hypothetical protein